MEERKECYVCKFQDKCRKIVQYGSEYCKKHRKEKTND